MPTQISDPSLQGGFEMVSPRYMRLNHCLIRLFNTRMIHSIIYIQIGRFYDLQQWTDVTFHLTDGSSMRGHKLLLAMSSPVFEGMFYGPMADGNANEFKVRNR